MPLPSMGPTPHEYTWTPGSALGTADVEPSALMNAKPSSPVTFDRRAASSRSKNSCCSAAVSVQAKNT
ncbi:hypothetical protein EON67_09055 [archaeon]|nr:MAG: hypothetical protein EON67_09055 [archaeon]